MSILQQTVEEFSSKVIKDMDLDSLIEFAREKLEQEYIEWAKEDEIGFLKAYKEYVGE